jgi:drug/metabolite transporter (DMT)-like permease
MSAAAAWLAVVAMLSLTVYAQLMLKTRVLAAGAIGSGLGGAAGYVGRLLLDPWVWSCFAAGFLAALCWMAALSRLSLSTAYPFITLTIAAVVLLNALLLGEPLRVLHIVGIGLIGIGLVAIAQA